MRYVRKTEITIMQIVVSLLSCFGLKMPSSELKFKVQLSLQLVAFQLIMMMMMMIILVSALWINNNNNNNTLAYAQNTNSTNIQQQPPQPPKLHAVKITSPAKGQQVLIGENNNNLTISGTSIANATSHCQISVIANGVKPYQNASATGPGGAADYSKWNFVLGSKYATIKQGPTNKITAKYTCSDNPAAISFYSVNVTGVATAASAAGRQQPSAITGNSTAAAG